MTCPVLVVYNDGVNTCGIAPPWLPILFWMIREGSSVDAPDSFEVSLPCTLARHHASHVPCDVSSRRCFLLQTQAVLYFGLPMLTDESLLRYSYAIASLLVAVFSALRFSRIPAAQALCADVDNFSTECGVLARASKL